MPSCVRVLWACAVAASLAACGSDDSGGAPTVAAAPSAPAPYIRETTNDELSVSIRIPAAVRALPGVGDRLIAEAESQAADVARRAAERRRENAALFRPSELWIEWIATFDSADAVSAQGQAFLNEGGANPYETLTGVAFDRALGREIGFADLFADPRPNGAAMTAVSDAAFDAWAATSPSGGTNLALIDERTLVDVREALRPRASSFDDFLLTRDERDPRRIGGVTLLYPEGALGPRSDGAFRLFVPVSALAPHLTPAWAARFTEPPGPEQ
jgi:hypothetical protein